MYIRDFAGNPKNDYLLFVHSLPFCYMYMCYMYIVLYVYVYVL
jgi:hypothetical protein